MIISFYSYKGGVGRTQLIANIASYLCFFKEKKILLIDWDLEAPGLHYYFNKNDIKHIGVIDLLNEYCEVSEKFEGTAPLKDLPVFTTEKYCSNILKSQNNNGKIDMFTAGLYDENYNTKINSFDWLKFYEQLNGNKYIELIKDKLHEFDYDFIFIDSRTGITDYTGITNVQLPEVNVILTIPNNQNFEGSLKIINGIENSPYVKKNLREAIIYPILSKIDTDSGVKSDEWMEKFMDTFDNKLSKIKKYLGSFKIREYTKKTYLEYFRDSAFEEKIFFMENTNPSINKLSENYENIANDFNLLKEYMTDSAYYKDTILTYLSNNKIATRKEIDNLLMNRLSNSLTEEQKRKKIKEILYEMSIKDSTIINISKSTKYPKWSKLI